MFQSGTRSPLKPFSIRASALAAVRNVLRNVSTSPQPLLATPTYQISTELVVGRWPLLRRLLADEYPPQIHMAVLFHEMSMVLKESDRMSHDNGTEANSGRIRELET